MSAKIREIEKPIGVPSLIFLEDNFALVSLADPVEQRNYIKWYHSIIMGNG